MKRALLASLVLVAGSSVACGGSDGGSDAADAPSGPPTDASTEAFCGVFTDFFTEVQGLGADAEDAEVVKALKATGDQLTEVGTPEDIPDDAREGFELTVESIQGLPDDATQDDIENIDKDFTEDENAKGDAFDEYLNTTCQETSGDDSGGSETPSPTDDAS